MTSPRSTRCPCVASSSHVARARQAGEVGRVAGGDAPLESALEVPRRADDRPRSRCAPRTVATISRNASILRPLPRAEDVDRGRGGRGGRAGARCRRQQQGGRDADPRGRGASRRARHGGAARRDARGAGIALDIHLPSEGAVRCSRPAVPGAHPRLRRLTARIIASSASMHAAPTTAARGSASEPLAAAAPRR